MEKNSADGNGHYSCFCGNICLQSGVDVIDNGKSIHFAAKKAMRAIPIAKTVLLRPANYPKGAPGKGKFVLLTRAAIK